MHDLSTPGFIAGIDIGGTNVRFALAEVGAPSHMRIRTATATPSTDGLEPFLDFLATELGACLRAVEAGWGDLAAVGCVAPGITDARTGVVRNAVNLGWLDVPLAASLAERLGVETAVENDVNAAALAEYVYGAGRGCHSLVYLTVSTGVAAGIVVENRLLRGYHHAAGEMGQFLPDRVHIGKDWGDNGCLEMTAAGVGLGRAWAQRQGVTSPTTTSAIEVFAAAESGDPEAIALVERAADYLAQAAVAIGTLIDPEVLVLGGSIAQNEALIANRIKEVVQTTLPFVPRIVRAALGGDAPLIGALRLAARRLQHNHIPLSAGG